MYFPVRSEVVKLYPASSDYCLARLAAHLHACHTPDRLVRKICTGLESVGFAQGFCALVID
jgi:hypothetical protein